ncbi:hypothetical protein E4T38_00294 [Aureobasidium subglaciale]|nr:hypothetical protein E4T38_00294 [Aureobasidium subglaciale]KAI5232494.1 hypothetical protein E4T40_00293 [Aureobasidium subglaciale]KAI5234661.1 hypothetical protein E4T41_00293 [Aureobasidium subglaciale]KAI5268483.1 hypothetical protein E4T46_00293 [Aureobasidium subglaciale]
MTLNVGMYHRRREWNSSHDCDPSSHSSRDVNNQGAAQTTILITMSVKSAIVDRIDRKLQCSLSRDTNIRRLHINMQQPTSRAYAVCMLEKIIAIVVSFTVVVSEAMS